MTVSNKGRLRRFSYRVWFEWIRRAPRYQDSLTAAHEARSRKDWAEAAIHFASALQVRPGSPGLMIQLGHALKESGRIKEAEAAYRSAAKAAPASADAYLHLGHSLKLQDRRKEALEAYATAVDLAPLSAAGNAELIAAGGRRRLRPGAYSWSAQVAAQDKLQAQLETVLQALAAVEQVSTFPAEAWSDFRNRYPVPPIPTNPANSAFTPQVRIRVDAHDATPVAIRTTLRSLADSNYTNWTATVVAGAAVCDHPVASLARTDPRIAFVPTDRDDGSASMGEGPVLLISASLRLDARALDWFLFLAGASDADAVYAEHNHHLSSWRTGASWLRPALFGCPAYYDLISTPEIPSAVLVVQGSRLEALPNLRGPELRRQVLTALLAEGRPVAHAPLVLSSVGLRSAAETAAHVGGVLPGENGERRDDRILVIVPTRDHAQLLAACVESLRRFAARPELLHVLILDNRSVEPSTASLLTSLERAGDASASLVDEPFNWARFNNIGARKSDEPILVFANNDLEMLTVGWDDQVRQHLASNDVGIVGARLLYGDGTIQHAGIALGAVSGRPIHEGRYAAPDDGGPLGRWLRPREASAVTGAFMAMTRNTFDRVGGFDEALAIAYNDVDMCLRARSIGLSVLYAADIEAVHYESKTRGLALDASQIAWDDAEFAELYNRWGEAATSDPFINSHWCSTAERAFDGLRCPTRNDIDAAINPTREFDQFQTGDSQTLYDSRPGTGDSVAIASGKRE